MYSEIRVCNTEHETATRTGATQIRRQFGVVQADGGDSHGASCGHLCTI